MLTEIFYYYNIDFEDNINFNDLLKKILVFIRHEKWLADFIQENESNWMFTSHPKDQSIMKINHHLRPSIILLPAYTTANTVEFFTLLVQDLALLTQFYILQVIIQENICLI